jgi:LPP20 lipoprotein
MKNLLMLLLLSSCALFQPKPELSETAKETPSWVYSPYNECNEQAELCATGEAKTLAQADAQARNNLASIFEVNVKSEFNAQTTSTQTFPWQGAVREEVRHSLEESVHQILETVQIKKRAKDKGLTYSLASLDRIKSAELIGSRLSKLDDELNTLWSKRSRTNLRKIVRLYLERDKLNERYSIVSGSPRPSRMTYEDIMQWRQTRPRIEALALRVGQAPEWMTEKLKELLTEAGFRIVRGDAEKVISLNVDSIKEYLNVQGFEKYTFTLNLTSFDKGEKNKVLTISETVTGRTQADALLKVKSYFNEYIEQHLSDLHLD